MPALTKHFLPRLLLFYSRVTGSPRLSHILTTCPGFYYSFVSDFRLCILFDTMSLFPEDLIRQEKESILHNISQVPCPSSLLAAASMIKNIIGAADAEKKQGLHRETGRYHECRAVADGHKEEQGHCILVNEPVVEEKVTSKATIADGADHADSKQACHRHDCDSNPDGEQQQQQPTSSVLTLRRVPSRRPGRQFRKRERCIPFRESCHAFFSVRQDQLGQEAIGLGKVAAIIGRPSNVAIDWNLTERQQEEHGTAVAGAHASAAVPGDVAFSTNSASSSPPSHRQRGLYPSRLNERSTIRVISSETYLRRLFVTASLAHVLSLDTCLPRSVPIRRKVSSRSASEEGEWNEGRGEKATLAGNACSVQGWGGHDEAGRGDIRSNSSAESSRSAAASLIAAAEQHGSTFFKKIFPVTLIDSAGKLWSMMYVTASRDNLHSGRLVDGWETFCCANNLRIGDKVEFTRVESREQESWRLGKEAVARVIVRKQCVRNK